MTTCSLSALGDGYKYVDILPAEGAGTATVIRTAANGGSETNTEIERGRWCIGDYIAEFDECEVHTFT